MIQRMGWIFCCGSFKTLYLILSLYTSYLERFLHQWLLSFVASDCMRS